MRRDVTRDTRALRVRASGQYLSAYFVVYVFYSLAPCQFAFGGSKYAARARGARAGNSHSPHTKVRKGELYSIKLESVFFNHGELVAIRVFPVADTLLDSHAG